MTSEAKTRQKKRKSGALLDINIDVNAHFKSFLNAVLSSAAPCKDLIMFVYKPCGSYYAAVTEGIQTP